MKTNLSIVTIGNINAGKSSLINALLENVVCSIGAKGGSTRAAESFKLNTYGIHTDKLSLEIIDTPGLSEVDGKERASIAINAAYKGDLIIFVVKSDLLDTEKHTIKILSDINKPILLVFNQIDRYTEREKQDIANSLIKNVQGYIREENIFFTAACPVQKIIKIDEHGEEIEVERKGLPDVSILKSRIKFIAHDLGKHIDHIAGYHEQWKAVNEKLNHLNKLKESASESVLNHAVLIGTATAINPIPLIDMIGGASGIAILVKKIADVYGIDIKLEDAGLLAKDLLQGVVITMGAFSALVLGAGSLVKLIPFIGWAVGGVTQAASVAFIVFLIGETVSDYYANGQNWARNNSLKESLEFKMCSFDKDEITRKLKEQINSKLKNTNC